MYREYPVFSIGTTSTGTAPCCADDDLASGAGTGWVRRFRLFIVVARGRGEEGMGWDSYYTMRCGLILLSAN